MKIEIEVYTVGDHEPADGSLVLSWATNFPTLTEYRKRKGTFYSGEMAVWPTLFFYLSDVVGLEAMNEIRRRWDLRDDKKPRILSR
jgi:hypothetical protein